jgi:flagellar basal-body rod protein FlgB
MSESIAALFNTPTSQSLRLVLDTSVARQEALAANVANVNAPGYHRVDLSGDFQKKLASALEKIERGDSTVNAIRPKIEKDVTATDFRPDGNNVKLDQELVELTQNQARFQFASEMMARQFRGIKMAITGRSTT